MPLFWSVKHLAMVARAAICKVMLPVILLLGANEVRAAMVYVDATYNGNTVRASTGSATGWAEDPAVAPNSGNSNGLWNRRISGPGGFGFNSNIWQAEDEEAAPTIITFVTGLEPDSIYTGMRVYFIGKQATGGANDWFIDASIDGANFVTYKDGTANATSVNTANGGLGNVVTPAAQDTRWYANLPDAMTDSSGVLRVWVRPGTGSMDRSAYDGIAYDNVPIAVPEPSTAILAMVALACTVFYSRRRSPAGQRR